MSETSNRRKRLFFLAYVWDVPPETIRIALHMAMVG